MSDVQETAYELIEFENQLDDWAERMLAAIDSEAQGPRAERASAIVEQVRENVKKEFGTIHREFESCH